MKSKLLAVLFLFTLNVVAQDKPNILFIAVDDLKPILGCYGDKVVKTPNIDKLASMGTVFESNYCQQAVCGPTRASIMTGKRPDYTKVWDLKTKMRNMNPDILSLPQYLITQGYSTQGIGKIYDTRCVDDQLDAPSWSVPFYTPQDRYYSVETGRPALGRYQSKETKELAAKYQQEGKAKGMTRIEINHYVEKMIRPTVECLEMPDNAYVDGANTLQSKDILIKLKQNNQPFFFAVGFSKPHLPFVAPKKYWDLYNREDMSLSAYQEKSANGVDMALHNVGELRAYTDIPRIIETTKQKDFGLTLPSDKQKELIHGYYASVSYIDAQVGILLNTLDSLGLTENTIVVLWGDHGWHLGDHNLWCKHSNFEQATRTPLIIYAPGIAATTSNAPTEFVDVFPTLCDLAGVTIPKVLDGKSLKPLMNRSVKSVKDYAISQYPRSLTQVEKENFGLLSSKAMGYSLRDKRYRYTMWIGNDFNSSKVFNADYIIGTELYDYEIDPNETSNVVNKAAYKEVTKKLKAEMLDFFGTQVK